MMLFSRIALVSVCLVASACSTGMETVGEDQLGSQLTDVTVALPAKDQLPASLSKQDLYYCFSVVDSLGATPVYSPSTIDPAVGPCTGGGPYSDSIRQGDYEENIKLDQMLNSESSYVVTLVVGIKYAGPYSIDTTKLHYVGIKEITPADMKGKEKFELSLLMEKFGDGDGPSTITSGTELDLEVKPVFPDEVDAEGDDEDDLLKIDPIASKIDASVPT